MRLTLLGTGTPTPSLSRSSSSYLLEIGDDVILFDAANTTSSGHMDVARFAAQAQVKTCVLSHISEQMDVPGIPERLVREIGEVYAGNLVGGQDLMQIGFSEPAPKPLI